MRKSNLKNLSTSWKNSTFVRSGLNAATLKGYIVLEYWKKTAVTVLRRKSNMSNTLSNSSDFPS
jgi:hypothetical protein